MLKFQKELFYNCMAELPALFLAEWTEVIGDKPTHQELSPAWDKYIQMELSGLLILFTARDEGKLVGYILTILHPHLHFSDTLYAMVDAFYLAPEARERAAEFILANEDVLIEHKAKRINMAVAPSAWQYRLMKLLQYDKTESIFGKWL